MGQITQPGIGQPGTHIHLCSTLKPGPAFPENLSSLSLTMALPPGQCLAGQGSVCTLPSRASSGPPILSLDLKLRSRRSDPGVRGLGLLGGAGFLVEPGTGGMGVVGWWRWNGGEGGTGVGGEAVPFPSFLKFSGRSLQPPPVIEGTEPPF